uniref:Uncharacterized protein n=1 Tax=Panagrolaimus sp. PS1159 TaxID=55785 RepID=A0AC35GCS7_9BILA
MDQQEPSTINHLQQQEHLQQEQQYHVPQQEESNTNNNNIISELSENRIGMSLIASTRQYSIGMGKDLKPNSRLWIETINDPKLVHLYCLEESTDEKDTFFCGHCKQFNIITRCEIAHPDGGATELWEDTTHLLSCTRNKTDVEKYLQYFEKPIVAVEPKKKVSSGKQKRPRSRADDNDEEEDEHYIPTPSSTRGYPHSRFNDTPISRSRSPLYSTTETPRTTTPKSDGSATTEKYRGRKPNFAAMSIVPKTHYKLKNAPNGIVNEGTKLFIFTDPAKNLGNEFSYGVAFEGGYLFYCDNCSYLTRERQKRKAFYKVINGKIVIREANHYATCRPCQLRHIFNAEDENESGNNNDDESESNNVENENVYDSHTPETTIEYDSTAAPSPDILEPPRKVQKQRTRTIKTHAKSTAATALKSPTALTFRPVFIAQDLAAPSQPLGRTSAAFENASPSTSNNNIQQQTIVPIIPTRPLPPIPIQFQPNILPQAQTLLYNTPSSAQMREIASKFGYPFSYKCYQFWSSTLSSISEIKGTSKPIKTHPISSYDEFASLSLFLTGSEEYGKHIQEGIKEYFSKTYYTDNGFTLPTDISLHTLITNALTDIHFSCLSKMINCTIAIFNGENIDCFGLTNDETTPVMLLKKCENKFEPVLGIST